jgi:hypothetical protein
MTAISLASKRLVSVKSGSDSKSGDPSFKLVCLFCCSGLVASIALLMLGVDLTAAGF